MQGPREHRRQRRCAEVGLPIPRTPCYRIVHRSENATRFRYCPGGCKSGTYQQKLCAPGNNRRPHQTPSPYGAGTPSNGRRPQNRGRPQASPAGRHMRSAPPERSSGNLLVAFSRLLDRIGAIPGAACLDRAKSGERSTVRGVFGFVAVDLRAVHAWPIHHRRHRSVIGPNRHCHAVITARMRRKRMRSEHARRRPHPFSDAIDIPPEVDHSLHIEIRTEIEASGGHHEQGSARIQLTVIEDRTRQHPVEVVAFALVRYRNQYGVPALDRRREQRQEPFTRRERGSSACFISKQRHSTPYIAWQSHAIWSNWAVGSDLPTETTGRALAERKVVQSPDGRVTHPMHRRKAGSRDGRAVS